MFPSSGNVTLTKFTLSSFNWLDDDLPLLHMFSRCFGTTSNGCDSWTMVSAYSQSETMQNVLLSTPGTVTVQAEAKDTLGSSSTAVTEVEVVELMEDVSDDVLPGYCARSIRGRSSILTSRLQTTGQGSSDSSTGLFA